MSSLAYCVVVRVADSSYSWTRESTTTAPTFPGISKELADEWIPTARKNTTAASAVAGATEAEGDWNGP